MQNLIIEPKAQKFIRHLKDKDLYERIKEKMLLLQENAFPHGVVKLQGSRDSYRLRVGDYRILYTIRDDGIHIAAIAHRREVYR